MRENRGFAARRSGVALPWTLESASSMLFPRLAERAATWGVELSGGEQQMLAIGRALMTNPSCSSSTRRPKAWRRSLRDEIWRVLAEVRRSGLPSW